MAKDTSVDVTLTLDEIATINRIIDVSRMHGLLCTLHDDCRKQDEALIDKFNHLQESLVREFGEL